MENEISVSLSWHKMAAVSHRFCSAKPLELTVSFAFAGTSVLVLITSRLTKPSLCGTTISYVDLKEFR